jgi:beta-glucosidase
VAVNVTNSGHRTADEVVQLYIHQRYGTASRPVRELKGFARISLEAGRTCSVSFRVGPRELRYWNATVRDWVVDASTVDVWVGGDSTAPLGATFRVTG